MNRGRHKKNQTRKEELLVLNGAKDLRKWKNFTLDEIKWLINETIKQQKEYAQKRNIHATSCCLSVYENDRGASVRTGGITWENSEKGYRGCCKILYKLLE